MIILVRGEIAHIHHIALAVRVEGIDRVLLVLPHDRRRHPGVGKEHGLLHRVRELLHLLAEAHVLVEGTQVAPPQLPLLARQRRQHQRPVQRVGDARQLRQLPRHVLYSSQRPLSPTSVDAFHGQVGPHAAVLAVDVQRVQLHLLEPQLLAELAAHVVVVEDEEGVVYG